ncbi:MAG: two-component system, NtrC family, sensor kinase [Acidobacteriota bacterium]|jgi:signal transduction histidine kinase|nr:two-component system, NtrC family, sensor kinase [Acidobacteriota bacterium]
MRYLKLHTKTTVLASAITIAVLASVLALVNPRVADIVGQEQRARAELQAINLAEQISHIPAPRDPQTLAHLATVVRGAHPSIITVRIWERVGGVYVETAAAAGSAPAEELPEETIAALRNGLASKTQIARPAGSTESLYRVFAPVTGQGRYSGAVELIVRLDEAPAIATRFERTAVWVALVAVALITFATYLLFRQLVYRPIERLLHAMGRAEAGDLDAEAPIRASDELGLLSRSFNRMIGRIRGMTQEREEQRRVLQERVREATVELEQRNEQLEDANRELWQTTRRLTELERLAAAGQTAAQFAHEVGTPLNLISGHVQLLRARLAGDTQAQPRLETISAQIERIERIVRGMLDRTRPEAVMLTPLDLNALLLRIFDATAPALEARRVRLETDLEAGLPHIAGDADRLQQVFINLINNSLDAMPDGGLLSVRTGVVETVAKPEHARAVDLADAELSSQVFIEFSDNGCGMSEELRARIFDPFYTTKESGHGTGLGLVVVRQVIREHHGEIEVESEPERGACFRITLPARQQEAENKQELEEEKNKDGLSLIHSGS